MAILDSSQLNELGFRSIGKNVRISNKASIYGASNITIGDNVRIDDFCVLSAGGGGIKIGNHIHIAVYSSIIGYGGVIISDFSNISSRVSIYSSNDDYSGQFMSSPVIDSEFTNVEHAEVYIGRHVIIGSGSIVLPGSHITEGGVIGALSLVKGGVLDAFTIYAGSPIRKIKERDDNVLSLEHKFITAYAKQNK